MKWHQDTVFHNALSDDKYFSMIEEIISFQDGPKDEYYNGKNVDNLETIQEVSTLT